MPFIALILIFLMSSAAHAYSQGDLSRDCLLVLNDHQALTADGAFQRGMCFGAVIAVRQNFDAATHHIKSPGDFCVPEAATNGQLVRVVVKHLNETPRFHRLPASWGILAALKNAFPCQPSG